MLDLSESICVGFIARTHGIHGKVALRLDQLSVEDIQKMESVFIEIDGLPVPFFIESIEEKTSDTLLLTFTDIVNEESARELTGCKVYISKKYVNPAYYKNSLSELNELKDFTIIDTEKGAIGVLKSIINIELNPLMQITKNKKEILVPFQCEFLQRIDKKNKVIHVEIPDGLLELF